MATFTVTLDGGPDLALALRAWETRKRAEIARLVATAALDIDRAAKQLAPVDTGNLRQQIRPDVRRVLADLAAEVVSGASYAAFVEFGTRHMAAQPYLLPAFESVAPRFFAALVAALR